MSKIYLIIIDGGADRAIHKLGNKTPFEYAKIDNLDKITKNGRVGYVKVIDGDICPESDSGSMALLSYDPLIHYKGRGPLEGLGLGFSSLDGEWASFRVNYACYDENSKFLERRTSRDLSDEELEHLSREISENVSLSDVYTSKFNLYSFSKHRGILSIHSEETRLSGEITNSDPGFTSVGYFGTPIRKNSYKPLKAHAKSLDNIYAIKTAEIVNHFIERSKSVLANSKINKNREQHGKLPANLLLVRDGGVLPQNLVKFEDKFGKTLSMYGQMPAENGLAKLIGASYKSAVKDSEVEYEKYYIDLLDELKKDESEVVFVHLKGPDELGHDNRPFDKVKNIELIDKCFIEGLLNFSNEDDNIVVTCDHSTPCELGIHSSDPVPLCVFGKNIIPDSVEHFDENSAKLGSLKFKTVSEFLKFLIFDIRREYEY